MIKTTCILPPEIRQLFDSCLLSRPAKFCEDSETLWLIYLYIKDNLENKTKKYPDWHQKFLKLEATFLELYERIKIKEKERKEDENHFTKELFYSFRGFNYRQRNLFEGFKYRS